MENEEILVISATEDAEEKHERQRTRKANRYGRPQKLTPVAADLL
jgi:hypothetical protein